MVGDVWLNTAHPLCAAWCRDNTWPCISTCLVRLDDFSVILFPLLSRVKPARQQIETLTQNGILSHLYRFKVNTNTHMPEGKPFRFEFHIPTKGDSNLHFHAMCYSTHAEPLIN